MLKLLAALYDEAFAKAQILNLYDDSTGMFRADLVASAFDEWLESNLPKIPYNSVMGIDLIDFSIIGKIVIKTNNFKI